MLLGGLHRSSTTLFSYVKRPTSKQHMQIELVNTSNLVSSVAQMQSLLPSQHDSTRLDQFWEFTQKKLKIHSKTNIQCLYGFAVRRTPFQPKSQWLQRNMLTI